MFGVGVATGAPGFIQILGSPIRTASPALSKTIPVLCSTSAQPAQSAKMVRISSFFIKPIKIA